jgi:hypothetical protein
MLCACHGAIIGNKKITLVNQIAPFSTTIPYISPCIIKDDATKLEMQKIR